MSLMDLKTEKIEKLYYSTKEVAEILNESTFTIGYWHDVFDVGARLGDRHRLYTKEMIAKMHIIKNLIRVEKYTIPGAKIKLKQLHGK